MIHKLKVLANILKGWFKNLKIWQKAIFILLIIGFIFNFGENKNSQSVETKEIQKNVSVKIEIFNNIEETRKKLSEIGLGNLSEWKDDFEGGYMSITNYFELEIPKEKNVNNLAFYLNSKKPEHIESLQLVLNLNDASNRKSAIKTFAKTIEKTFKQLNLEIPLGLIKAASNPNSFKFENDNFSTNLKLEKTKIDTWIFEIITK
jgi:hypothetical protein